MIASNHKFICTLIWSITSLDSQALATSCQIYPSEYSYLGDSVNTNESSLAKCEMYPDTLSVLHSEHYIYCNGRQLRLTDSDLGTESRIDGSYYIWPGIPSSDSRQLLFVFPMQVRLTIITLHYYNIQGRPKLRFFAVPDDFKIWTSPIASYRHVDIDAVPSGAEITGQNNISINADFVTKKLLMSKYPSNSVLAVSEVEFFTCTTLASTPTVVSTDTSTTYVTNNGRSSFTQNTSFSLIVTTSASQVQKGASPTTQQDSNTEISLLQTDNFTVPLVAGVVAVILTTLVAITILLVLLLLWSKNKTYRLRRDSKLKEKDNSYSTLDRGTTQQLQPQPCNVPSELYDKIQLSPFTGQPELIPNNENEKKNNCTSLSPGSQNMKESKVNETNSELLGTEKTNSDDCTYAVVDKTKKKRRQMDESEQQSTSKKDTHHINPQVLNATLSQESHAGENPKDQMQENLEEMYAVVHKKPTKCEEQETAPPVPSHTIESLYTAIQKPK